MFEAEIEQIQHLVYEFQEISNLLKKGDSKSLLDIFSAKNRTQNLTSVLPLKTIYQKIAHEVENHIKETGFRLRKSFDDDFYVRFDCFEVFYKDFQYRVPLVKLELSKRMIHPVHPINFELLQQEWSDILRVSNKGILVDIQKQKASFLEYESKLPDLTSALEPLGFSFYSEWK